MSHHSWCHQSPANIRATGALHGPETSFGCEFPTYVETHVSLTSGSTAAHLSPSPSSPILSTFISKGSNLPAPVRHLYESTKLLLVRPRCFRCRNLIVSTMHKSVEPITMQVNKMRRYRRKARDGLGTVFPSWYRELFGDRESIIAPTARVLASPLSFLSTRLFF